MKNVFYALSVFFLYVVSGNAMKADFNPTPQNVHFYGKHITPTDFQLKTTNIHSVSLQLLRQILVKKEGKKQNIEVFVGTKNEPFAKKITEKIPQKKEGYYLSIDEKSIYIIGNDQRGVYYGIRTLEYLLKLPQIPVCEIVDYPDIASRGVVEGFYGMPWSHEKRIRQIEFYGRNKLNTYIYGPKDDPYHSSPNWRLPYPEKEALQIKELVQKSDENFVDFVWAIHPGKDIKWNEKDRNNLLMKFQSMYDLGVRAFAVFFDDISGEGTNPENQAELLNYIHNQFISKKKDVKPLIMCPTEYNKSWSDPKKRYLEILGEKLHPNIEIMWTGDRVVADISQETLSWINPKIKRKAYIWWNFPVSDYVRDHLLLGAVYGNGLDIKNQMAGFVSNPMEHPEASKIAIYSVADYTWNVENFKSEASWQRAITDLMPQHRDELLTFAKHNSDLGANGHLYRRVESVDFKPITENFMTEFDKFQQNTQTQKVITEFEKIVSSAQKLAASSENNFLIEEIIHWIHQFNYLGEKGLEIMKMYEAYGKNEPTNFVNSYKRVQNIQQTMFAIDQRFNQNPYQPGIKVATLVVEPFLNDMQVKLIEKFNKKYNKDLKVSLVYNPNKLITNVKRIESQPLQQRNQTLSITPLLEYVSFATNDFLGIELEKIENIKSIRLDLEKAEMLSQVSLQVSSDAKEWINLSGNIKNSQLSVNQEVKNIKYIRFINTSNKTIELKLKKFEIVFF